MDVKQPNLISFNEVRWRCKRGMLELDLFLLPFCDAVFVELSPAMHTLFIELLEQPDPQLLAWFMNYESCHEKFDVMVKKIREFRTTNNNFVTV